MTKTLKADGRRPLLDRAARAEREVPVAIAAEGPSSDRRLFGRMFPGLSPLVASDSDLASLAAAMRHQGPLDEAPRAECAPAGFTYLARFIEHDITFDPDPLSARTADPAMCRRFRTPSLDLDSLYGSGPGPHRFLFRQDVPKFLIGMTAQSKDALGVDLPPTPNDFERNRNGVPLIADYRNDEHVVVAQTHVAFLKFHNKVVDTLLAAGYGGELLFLEAARVVRWHYQWIVLYDFVQRFVEPGTVDHLLLEGRTLFQFDESPFIPLEFIAGVFRFVDSMVNDEYSHNRVFRPEAPRLAAASFEQLQRFTSLAGEINGTQPGGFDVLPSNWVIDWRRWYDFRTPLTATAFELNRSGRIDPYLTSRLHALPGSRDARDGNLVFTHLHHGVMLGLPSGQDIAAELKIDMPSIDALSADEIASGSDGEVAWHKGFHRQSPLWYYLLKEAQIKGQGSRLGPVGGRLLAEVFVGLLQGTPDSFLSSPGWFPTLPSASPGTFTMTDLLQFVGDVSPIDGITTVDTL